MNNFVALKKIHLYSAEVRNIVSILDETVKLSYFQYDRVDKSDNGRIILTTRPDWYKHCIKNKYYEISYFESILSTRCNKTVFWEMVSTASAPVFEAAAAFNMKNGFTIICVDEKFVEYFHFAMPMDSMFSHQLYQDRFSLFVNFIYYFREKSKRLVSLMQNYQYYYNSSNIYDINNKDSSVFVNPKRSVSELSPKKLYISASENVYLTSAELECFKEFLILGSAEKVANKMNISARTVYAHFENVKNRLNCRTLFQVGELLSDTLLFKDL